MGSLLASPGSRWLLRPRDTTVSSMLAGTLLSRPFKRPVLRCIYRKDPSQQPRLQEGKQRLSQALKRKTNSLKDLAKGTGHKVVLWEPNWALWPKRGKAKAKCRVGTLITCTRCHRLGNAGWESAAWGVWLPNRGTESSVGPAQQGRWSEP